MKKRNHPANVVDVSSRIMGLLGRRKVDPTTDAMKAFKPGFEMAALSAGCNLSFDPDDVAKGIEQAEEMNYNMRTYGTIDVPRFALPLHLQQSGRFMRQPGLTPDEQKRLIDVLERHLA